MSGIVLPLSIPLTASARLAKNMAEVRNSTVCRTLSGWASVQANRDKQGGKVSNDKETRIDEIELGTTQAVRENEVAPQAAPNPPDLLRKRKRKPDATRPLDTPEDEAIAQYLTTPKSIREFKSLTDLAKHFGICRMTVYRRTKDLIILERAEWLLTYHRLAGDLIPRLHWERIMAGQVKAAAAGDTKAAQFCKERAWPELDIFGNQVRN